MKLITQTIARNESSRYLKDVLSCMQGYADVMVFTDDASTDDTPDLAEEAGCEVLRLPEQLFTTDEGKLRSLAWEHLEQFAEPGDWVLAIDADEIFYGVDGLYDLMIQDRYDVLGVTFFHMWNETQFRVDKLWAPSVSTRLFRYFEGGTHRDRKLACGAEPTYVSDLVRKRRFLVDTPFRMKHLGYMAEGDKMLKHQRYMDLDNGKYHNINHLNSIIDEQITLIDWMD